MATKFYLSPKENKAGDYPIRVSISIRGTRLISTIGYGTPRENWDDRSQSVKKGHTNEVGVPYNVINSRLLKIRSHFAEYEMTIGHKPSIEELAEQLAAIKGKTKKTKSTNAPTALMYFDEFVREQSRVKQWTDGTTAELMAFRNHLKVQGVDLPLSHFNEAGVNGMIDYFRRVCKMSESTIRQKYRYLYWWLHWCARRGYIAVDIAQFQKPKFRVIAKPVIFLTKEELMKLYTLEIPDDGTIVTLTDMDGNEYEKVIAHADLLRKVRDCFCFCCFTSLRYSDMTKLHRTDINGNSIRVVTKKTNDAIEINLNDYSKAILNKYSGMMSANGFALPHFSISTANMCIKELGELCGFNTPIVSVSVIGGRRVEVCEPKWKMLSTHTGRKTFICYALGIGIPPQVVMKWTGHSDYKAMQPYIDIAESTKAEAMQLFNDNIKR